MDRRTKIFNSGSTKILWFGMVILLGVSTIFLVSRQTTTSNVQSFSQIEVLKDSLVMSSNIHGKSGLFSNWMKVYGQKQLIEAMSRKDSLSEGDKELIRQIDRELNTMLHEGN